MTLATRGLNSLLSGGRSSSPQENMCRRGAECLERMRARGLLRLPVSPRLTLLLIHSLPGRAVPELRVGTARPGGECHRGGGTAESPPAPSGVHNAISYSIVSIDRFYLASSRRASRCALSSLSVPAHARAALNYPVYTFARRGHCSRRNARNATARH